LREAVRSGRLAPGTRLPSSRALAGDLGVARNTVAEVYTQLVAEGWLTARQGSGTRVSERHTASGRPASPAALPARPPASTRRTARYDLRVGRPDVSAFPRSAWVAATRRAVTGARPRPRFGYADPQGLPVLREALAEYLSRVRGVRATPDQVVVCSGFAQGLGLICDVLSGRGVYTLAVEACGHGLHRAIAHAHGLEPWSITLDGAGAVISGVPGSAALLLTPAHQFPLGMMLAAQRRAEALQWAADTDSWVVEDDYDGEFRYDRQPVGAMQSLAPDQVIYAGTASKALVPGLRLGWLVPPGDLVSEVVAAKELADTQSSTLDQLTLAEFLRSGAHDRQVRKSRLGYRRRRDRLVSALRGQLPDLRIGGIAAGLHLVIWLPEGVEEDHVIDRGARHGLALQGLREFTFAAPAYPPALVVGYATPPDHAFSGAVARLVATIAEVLR
jgi:GntR family transcriptional regulator/MocR family aminotransferase